MSLRRALDLRRRIAVDWRVRNKMRPSLYGRERGFRFSEARLTPNLEHTPWKRNKEDSIVKKHLQMVSRKPVALAEEDLNIILKLTFFAQILQAVDGWVQRKEE